MYKESTKLGSALTLQARQGVLLNRSCMRSMAVQGSDVGRGHWPQLREP